MNRAAMRQVGITRRRQLTDTRNEIVKMLAGNELHFSAREISRIIRINSASAARIMRYGKNTSKPETSG